MAGVDDHNPSSHLFDEHDHYYYSDNNCNLPATPGDDLFSILESLEDGGLLEFTPHPDPAVTTTPPLAASDDHQQLVAELDETNSSAPKTKRLKLSSSVSAPGTSSDHDGQQRMSHITVERNRRKQMNDHLSVLRSLMPCFYVKRGDQASIIGGVVDYINELQQVLQSLEAKRQRKVYSEVLSPRVVSSPRPPPPPGHPSPLILSPRKPPLSPRLPTAATLPPISPRTPQPTSPYKPPTSCSSRSILQQQPPPNVTNYLISSPNMAACSSLEPSPTSSSATSSINNIDNLNELFANSKSAIADVEVKFSGPNVLLKTVSPRIPGQALRIISALEDLSLEILHVSITTVDETMLNSFTIKIGIECQLSAEELAHQIQQTFY